MNDVLNTLLSRASNKLLVAPGPSDQELDWIMQAAMRAPDHGAIRPWRFKLIRGEMIPKFAQFAVDKRQSSDRPMTEQKARASLAWLSNVPLIIAVGSCLNHDNRIPEKETVLATGCAVMNILNAAHSLGYGAFWSTGVATYIDEFQQAMGFDALDYDYLGMVVIGTHMSGLPEKERPDWHEFTQDWQMPE